LGAIALRKDRGLLSIYAADRSSDGTLTLVIINKTNNNLTSNLSLKRFKSVGKAQFYTYSEGNLGAIVRQSDLGVSDTGFQTTYSANSMTLVAIPKG